MMGIHRYKATGQRRGMPCPCKNMAMQHVDIDVRILF
jgi:hypothetical protein